MNRNKFELRFHFLLAGQHTCYFRGFDEIVIIFFRSSGTKHELIQ